jgi:hypothetical protein
MLTNILFLDFLWNNIIPLSYRTCSEEKLKVRYDHQLVFDALWSKHHHAYFVGENKELDIFI